MSDKVRLGVVGLGPMGRDLVRPAAKHESVDVVALCDLDSGLFPEAQEIVAGHSPTLFTDFYEMLDMASLDGLIVAVPQDLHKEFSIAGLEAGCHVFCEKPMALTTVDCESMIATAQSTGKALMIGQVLRYIGVYRYVLERATSGEFGAPVAMRTCRTMGGFGTWARPWRTRYDQCGGLLLEVNVHEIDLMLCILGHATSVTAAGANFIMKDVDYEDFITAHIQFANGCLGSITSVYCDFVGHNNGEIYLQDGTIYYNSLASQVCIARKGESVERIPYDQIHPEWEPGVDREIREFIETCLGSHPVTIPGEDGMRAVEVGEAAYISARENRTVRLPLPRNRTI